MQDSQAALCISRNLNPFILQLHNKLFSVDSYLEKAPVFGLRVAVLVSKQFGLDINLRLKPVLPLGPAIVSLVFVGLVVVGLVVVGLTAVGLAVVGLAVVGLVVVGLAVVGMVVVGVVVVGLVVAGLAVVGLAVVGLVVVGLVVVGVVVAADVVVCAERKNGLQST